jgi:hypothetical protein
MSLILKRDQQILEHPHKHRTLSPVRIGTDNSTIRVRSRSHNQEQDGNTGGMCDQFNKLRLIANKDFLVQFIFSLVLDNHLQNKLKNLGSEFSKC